MIEIQFVERNGDGNYVCQFGDTRDDSIRLRLTDARLDRLRIDAVTQLEFSIECDGEEGCYREEWIYDAQRKRVDELFDRIAKREADPRSRCPIHFAPENADVPTSNAFCTCNQAK